MPAARAIRYNLFAETISNVEKPKKRKGFPLLSLSRTLLTLRSKKPQTIMYFRLGMSWPCKKWREEGGWQRFLKSA